MLYLCQSWYLWQGHDKVMKLGLFRCENDIVHVDLPQIVPILDVVSDAAVEQDRFLGDNADLRAQKRHVCLGGVVAVNQLFCNTSTLCQSLDCLHFKHKNKT